jgi:hypothetical protein
VRTEKRLWVLLLVLVLLLFVFLVFLVAVVLARGGFAFGRGLAAAFNVR